MRDDVWITGVGLVSSLGEGPDAHLAALGAAPAPVLDTTGFAPFPVHPAPALELDRQIPKKGDQRQMEPWQRLGTYAAGLALDHAGARQLVGDTHLVVAAGGGERDVALDAAIAGELATLPPEQAAPLLNDRLASGLRPTLFLAQLSNLLAGNISIVHGIAGSSRTLMGEESAGADAVRIATARLAEGRGAIALVGGAFSASRWDMLLPYAAGGVLWRGDWAPVTRRQAAGGGLVFGSAGAFLVLERASAARARGARGLARITGIATGAARRRGEDTARASAAALAGGLAIRHGATILSGASGVGWPSESAFLEELPPPRRVLTTSDWLGHAIEATFPLDLALAALHVAAGGVAQALVTGFGVWRGEALALLEPIDA